MTQNLPASELEAQGLSLRLQFTGPDQEGWLVVFADVSADPFSGAYAFGMESEELGRLVRDLEHLERSVGKESEIAWENCEGNMRLELSLDSQGQIAAAYRFAAGLGWEGAVLSGEFRADQSYLRGWIRQFEQVQRELG